MKSVSNRRSSILGTKYSDAKLRELAVFYRTNAQSRALEEALVDRKLPYVMFGGVKFYARMEIKDVLSYLRLLVNPADSLAARRVINVPARGIGATTVDKIARCEEQAGGFLLEEAETNGHDPDLTAEQMQKSYFGTTRVT